MPEHAWSSVISKPQITLHCFCTLYCVCLRCDYGMSVETYEAKFIWSWNPASPEILRIGTWSFLINYKASFFLTWWSYQTRTLLFTVCVCAPPCGKHLMVQDHVQKLRLCSDCSRTAKEESGNSTTQSIQFIETERSSLNTCSPHPD